MSDLQAPPQRGASASARRFGVVAIPPLCRRHILSMREVAARLLVLAGAACGLAGCSSTAVPATVELAGKVLETVGLKTPEPPKELPEVSLPPRRIAMRLHASSSLNVDTQGQSIALVVRVFHLRNVDSFQKLPYADFGNATRERELLGQDLISVRDLQLIPGQQLQWAERAPREVGYVGVVGLFHSPAPQRWRYAFATAGAESTGVAIGAHSCTLSVQVGDAVGIDKQLARFGPGLCQ